MKTSLFLILGIIFISGKCSHSTNATQKENVAKINIPEPKTLLWKLKTNYVDCPIIYKTGKIYFGSEAGMLYCLDSNGIIDWKMKLNGNGLNTLIFANDSILCAEIDSDVAGINIKTQKILWRNHIPKLIALHMKVVNSILYFSCNDSFFYGIDIFLGKIVTRVSFAGMTNSGGEIFPGFSHIYFIAEDSILPLSLFCVDFNGKLIKKTPLSDYPFTNPVSTGDTIIYKFRHNEIRAMNLQNEKELWNYHYTPELGQATSIRIGDIFIFGNSVYTNISDSEICALNLHTGELKWRVNCHSDLFDIFYVSKDKLFYSSNNDCYSINLKSLEQKLEFRMNDFIRYPTYANHTFYFTGKDSVVYAIKDKAQ